MTSSCLLQQIHYHIRQMQIKLNKPLSDLTHLLMRNNLQPTPKRSSLINQYPSKHYKENQLNGNNMSRSPARSASRKTLNSKEDSLIAQNESRNRARSRKEEGRRCQNHEENEGQFHINIEGQDLYYCERCALKLKNQGFPIRRMTEAAVNEESRRREQQHRNVHLAAYSHYQGHPQFQTLKKLLSFIYESQQRVANPEHSRNIEQFLTKLTADLDRFYDAIEQAVRTRREAARAELQALSESVMEKWKGAEFVEAFEEIRMMKKDIEENVDSIIGEVEEDTFEQCVQNYRDRLDSLNKISEQRIAETDKIKQNYERFLESEAHSLLQDLQRIDCRPIICSSQKVLVSEASDPAQQQPPRGPFRNLFNHQKSRKRLISRK